MDIENACRWLKADNPSCAGEALLYRAGKRAALLAADEYSGHAASADALALVALDLCVLAREVGFKPGAQRLIGCEQSLRLAHVTSWISDLILQLPTSRLQDAPVVLARIFAVLDRCCMGVGTTLGEALDQLIRPISCLPIAHWETAPAADRPSLEHDDTHAARRAKQASPVRPGLAWRGVG